MNDRTLVIQFKDQMMKPSTEKFKNIKTVADAEDILSRRVRKNIHYALYKGKYLIAPEKEIKKPTLISKQP